MFTNEAACQLVSSQLVNSQCVCSQFIHSQLVNSQFAYSQTVYRSTRQPGLKSTSLHSKTRLLLATFEYANAKVRLLYGLGLDGDEWGM